MRDIEVCECDICNKVKPVERKYYRYDIICECCNGSKDHHFEIVRYCSDCEPKPPIATKVCIKPSDTLNNVYG